MPEPWETRVNIAIALLKLSQEPVGVDKKRGWIYQAVQELDRAVKILNGEYVEPEK